MAKKTNVNDVMNGDMKFNVVTLRSVYGKVGQQYFIQPMRSKETGMYPDCVKQVDSHGDMILTDAERNSGKIFIPITETIVVLDGTTFDLNKPLEAARWEAIKNCPYIAESRWAKDENGNYIIDGTVNVKSVKIPRYGMAELYIEKPGQESMIKNSRKEKVANAFNYIMNDPEGLTHLITVAKVLGRNMRNAHDADIKDYLYTVAEKDPDKIINCYTGGDMKMRMLFIDAKERQVIRKKGGMFIFGEDGDTILGASDEAVIAFLMNSKNAKVQDMIRKETYPDLFNSEN